MHMSTAQIDREHNIHWWQRDARISSTLTPRYENVPGTREARSEPTAFRSLALSLVPRMLSAFTRAESCSMRRRVRWYTSLLVSPSATHDSHSADAESRATVTCEQQFSWETSEDLKCLEAPSKRHVRHRFLFEFDLRYLFQTWKAAKALHK